MSVSSGLVCDQNVEGFKRIYWYSVRFSWGHIDQFNISILQNALNEYF